MKIKKNDNIIVITGKDKGKTGKVIKSIPSKNKVVVEGVNIKKKHQKPTKSNQKGQTIEIALPVDVSNVALVEGGKAVKVGMSVKGEKKIRISRKSGKSI